MPDEVFDAEVVLREYRFTGPPGPDEIKRVYDEYLIPPESWHGVVHQLIHNRRVSWDMLTALRERLGLSELDFRIRLMLIVWVYLARPKSADLPRAEPVVRTVMVKPSRRGSAKTGPKINLGVDLEALAAGRKTGDLVKKLTCIVVAHRQKSERVSKLVRRLLAEHPGWRGFKEFVEPALSQGGFKSLSVVQYSRIVEFYPPDEPKTARAVRATAETGTRRGRHPRSQAGPKPFKIEAKIACLVAAADGGDTAAVMKRLLAEHPDRTTFLGYAGSILDVAGLRNFSYAEYSGLRQRFAPPVQPGGREKSSGSPDDSNRKRPPAPGGGPKGKSGAGLIRGNYRQKAQALARHNGWDVSDSSVRRLMAQLRRSASNNAGTFREAVNEQADEAGIDRFSPEEADELYRLGEAPVPAEV